PGRSAHPMSPPSSAAARTSSRAASSSSSSSCLAAPTSWMQRWLNQSQNWRKVLPCQWWWPMPWCSSPTAMVSASCIGGPRGRVVGTWIVARKARLATSRGRLFRRSRPDDRPSVARTRPLGRRDLRSWRMTTATSFTTLALPAALLQGIDALGYSAMTPVQAQSLPAILEGRDVIAQAPTGSGKTAAFGLGLLARIDPGRIKTQALVLCPTRELADQVGKQLRRLATGIANLKLSILCGGIPLGPQLASLTHDP